MFLAIIDSFLDIIDTIAIIASALAITDSVWRRSSLNKACLAKNGKHRKQQKTAKLVSIRGFEITDESRV